MLLDQLAEQEYLQNYVSWMKKTLEKPDDLFDLSCTKTTKYYLSQADAIRQQIEEKEAAISKQV